MTKYTSIINHIRFRCFPRNLSFSLRNLRTKKLISLLTITCFIFSSVLSQPLYGLIEKSRSTDKFNKIFDDLVIPGSVGRITEVNIEGGGTKDEGRESSFVPRPSSLVSQKVVINIQDLHCHGEVQKNISKIISILDSRYKLKQVYVEGASGDVDTSWLMRVKDNDVRKNIINALVDDGKLSGPEHYSVLAKKTNLLKGCDDKKLHTENLLRLNSIVGKQNQIDKSIENIKSDLETLKRKYYNSANKKLDRVIKKYRDKDLGPQKYYSYLFKRADKLDIDVDRFRNISEFSNIFRQTKKLKYKRIGVELQGLMALIKQKLPYKAYNLLKANTNNFSKTDELYVYLSRLVDEYNLNLNTNFPNLKKFFNYLETSGNVNPIELISEEQKLINEIRLRLAVKQSEREVVFMLDFTGYLKDYFAYKTSPDDLRYVENNLPKFRMLWARYFGNDKLSGLDKYMVILSRYYDINKERNYSMLSNSRVLKDEGRETRDEGRETRDEGRRMRDDKAVSSYIPRPSSLSSSSLGSSSSSYGHSSVSTLLKNADEIVVLITGGFHTPGITEILKGRNVSYLVITPNVTTGTELSETTYTRMLNKQSKLLAAVNAKVAAGFSLRDVFNITQAKACGYQNKDKDTDYVQQTTNHEQRTTVVNALALIHLTQLVNNKNPVAVLDAVQDIATILKPGLSDEELRIHTIAFNEIFEEQGVTIEINRENDTEYEYCIKTSCPEDYDAFPYQGDHKSEVSSEILFNPVDKQIQNIDPKTGEVEVIEPEVQPAEAEEVVEDTTEKTIKESDVKSTLKIADIRLLNFFYELGPGGQWFAAYVAAPFLESLIILGPAALFFFYPAIQSSFILLPAAAPIVLLSLAAAWILGSIAYISFSRHEWAYSGVGDKQRQYVEWDVRKKTRKRCKIYVK